MADEKPKRTCASKGCDAKLGLKKTKAGNWMCVAHHPESKKKHKESTSRGGKKSAKVQHGERLLLTLKIDGNKQSVVKALVDQVNFLAKDVGQKEIKRHRLIVDINKLIHEFATEGVGEGEKDEKVKQLLESKLPPSIKLGKLVDLVGPVHAMELVEVELERDTYEEKTLDGVALLQGGDGKAPGISVPDSFSIEEKDDTADDVPELDVGIPDRPEGQAQAAQAPQALPGTGAPADKPPETLEERKARATHQTNELVGLYRTKIVGSIRKIGRASCRERV